jgi:hypothetical protein
MLESSLMTCNLAVTSTHYFLSPFSGWISGSSQCRADLNLIHPSVAGLIPSAVVNFGPIQSQFQATSQLPTLIHGDYSQDLASGKYSLSWASTEKMMTWLKHEEETQVIELQLKGRRVNGKKEKVWTEKFYYVCARQGTGGEKYQKSTQSGVGRF